jgi:hypothetical protein
MLLLPLLLPSLILLPLLLSAPDFAVTDTREMPLLLSAPDFAVTGNREMPLLLSAPNFAVTDTREMYWIFGKKIRIFWGFGHFRPIFA